MVIDFSVLVCIPSQRPGYLQAKKHCLFFQINRASTLLKIIYQFSSVQQNFKDSFLTFIFLELVFLFTCRSRSVATVRCVSSS